MCKIKISEIENPVIITKFVDYGRHEVIVYDDMTKIGSFETTDMQLVDDINEMNDGQGDETELMMHDSFDEVIDTCLNRLIN